METPRILSPKLTRRRGLGPLLCIGLVACAHPTPRQAVRPALAVEAKILSALDEDVTLRREAIRLLGDVGEARHVPVLARRLRSEDPHTGRAAVAALASMAGQLPAVRRQVGQLMLGCLDAIQGP